MASLACSGGGDVLGLCAAAPAGGGATCVFSASSGGDVRCHAVQWAGSAAALHPLWTAASSGCLHGVSWDADGQELAEHFDRGFTACDPDGDNALDLDEFRSFVLTVAPDAAVKVELVLSKGYVVIFASPPRRRRRG